MNIGNPHVLFLFLGIIPIMVIFFLIYKNGTKNLRKIGQVKYKEVFLDAYFRKTFFSSLFFILAYFFLVLTLSDIRWKKEYVVEQPSGVDVVFLVDVSNSMLSNDIVPRRLDRVKRILSILVEPRANFRYSLVAFKGGAVQQIPMTEDIEIFSSRVEFLSPNLITIPGTSLGDGIKVAMKSFPSGKVTRKIILLFSDGGNEDMRNVHEYSTLLQQEKIKLIAVGCGTEKGGEILLNSDEKMMGGDGNPLRVGIQESFMQTLAKNTDGKYFQIQNPSFISDLEVIFQREVGWVGVTNHIIKMVPEHSIFLSITVIFLLLFAYVRSYKFRGVF